MPVVARMSLPQEEQQEHNEELDKLLKPKIKQNEFDGFIVMFDVTKNSTFEDAKFFINMISLLSRPIICSKRPLHSESNYDPEFEK